VRFNARESAGFYAYASDTVPVQLSVPAVQGLTVTVYSSCFAAGSTAVTFAAGESTQALTFSGANDADVYNAQRCGLSYVLSGPDAWLFTPPADTVLPVVNPNAELRFLIGTTEWAGNVLSSASGALFEGVDSPLFYASLSTSPSTVVKATLSSPSAVFTPATLVFSPSAWAAQAFYFTPTRAEIGSVIAVYVTFEGNDALNVRYSPTPATVGPFFPRFAVGGVHSLMSNTTAQGWMAVKTPFSAISSQSVGIVPFCGTGGRRAVQSDLSQIVFEPPVLWLSNSATNVSFSYSVRDTLRPNAPNAPACSLTYAFLTSQGDWINNNFVVDPTNAYGNPLVATITYGNIGVIYIYMPGAVGIDHDGRRFSLIVSPPSDAELVVRAEGQNLIFDPPLVVIPPGVSEVKSLVRARTRPKQSHANDAGRVTWTLVTSTATTRYRLACGGTTCYTYHRVKPNN